MRKVVLAAVFRKCGLTLKEVAAECRRYPGGRGIGTTVVSAYLSGHRPIGDAHFKILCRVLRVKPESVYTSRYLATGREPIAA